MNTSVSPRRGFLLSFLLGKFSLTKPGQFLKRYGLFSLFLLTLSAVTMAGTDTTFTSFDGIYNLIVGWVTGLPGKLFAVAGFVVGMGMGIVRQSVMAIVIGVAVGLVMFYGPGIIEGIVTFAI